MGAENYRHSQKQHAGKGVSVCRSKRASQVQAEGMRQRDKAEMEPQRARSLRVRKEN